MKVAIVGGGSFDTLEYHLREAFSFAGHDARIFDIYDRWIYGRKTIGRYARVVSKILRDYGSKFDASQFGSMAREVNDFGPNLVVCVYRFIPPQFVRDVKAAGRRVIHINPDQLTTLENQQIFASDYDVWFTKDPYMLRFMRDKMNLNAVQYNEAFNRRVHRRPETEKARLEEELDIDVLSFGSLYPYRTNMLACLQRQGVKLRIFGKTGRYPSPPDLKGCIEPRFILGEEKARYVCGARIVFNNLHYAEVESVNNKFFEINGMGGFQLCDYRPILRDLLPVDPEKVSFRTIGEAVSKIRYYLEHTDERREIAERIYGHFADNHSYDRLIDHLLNHIS